MTQSGTNMPFVALACGGTGGHLFPGLAVADQLTQHGCAVVLLISPKDIDQQAVKSAFERRSPNWREGLNHPGHAGSKTGAPMEIVTLPAVALQNRNYLSFARSFWHSWRAVRKVFKSRPPHAVLAMGGFTSAPPVLAAKKFGAKTFLHESNTIPGRANRFLARFVNEAFVGFPEAATHLKACRVTTTGTPVRPQFQPCDPGPCRAAFGLDPHCPTVLVMGGSQGASGLNELILSVLPLLQERERRVRESMPLQKYTEKLFTLQFLHLTGANDFEKVRAAYAAHGMKAGVKPFLAQMERALDAATVAVSRAGASSLAEIAALRLPSLLVPFPAAADNHQYHNARAFEKTGAAKLLEQKNATPEKVAAILTELVGSEDLRAKMQSAVAQWHAPGAAKQIAAAILQAIAEKQSSKFQVPSSKEISSPNRQIISRVAGFGIWNLTILWSLEPGVRNFFTA